MGQCTGVLCGMSPRGAGTWRARRVAARSEDTRGAQEAAARCTHARQTRCRHLADSARCSRVTVVAAAAPSHLKIKHRSNGTWGQPRWCAPARMQTSLTLASTHHQRVDVARHGQIVEGVLLRLPQSVSDEVAGRAEPRQRRQITRTHWDKHLLPADLPRHKGYSLFVSIRLLAGQRRRRRRRRRKGGWGRH